MHHVEDLMLNTVFDNWDAALWLFSVQYVHKFFTVIICFSMSSLKYLQAKYFYAQNATPLASHLDIND